MKTVTSKTDPQTEETVFETGDIIKYADDFVVYIVVHSDMRRADLLDLSNRHVQTRYQLDIRDMTYIGHVDRFKMTDFMGMVFTHSDNHITSPSSVTLKDVFEEVFLGHEVKSYEEQLYLKSFQALLAGRYVRMEILGKVMTAGDIVLRVSSHSSKRFTTESMLAALDEAKQS